MIRKLIFSGLILLVLFTPSRSQNLPLFKLLSVKETGIDFKNEIRESEDLNVLTYEYFYNGGGVAAGDINNDGLIDLYFTANMKPDKLYLNLGNLKFKDITKDAKINGKPQWKTGVTMADVNGDGWLDIYVCYSGSGDTESRRNKLYINKGNLTFSEEAKVYGLDDPAYSTQAVFFDYDRDGDLDMYLLNHNIKDYKDIELSYLKTKYDSLAGDKLFRNDDGFFRDVSKEAGIFGNIIGFGLGVTVADINNDGWPDIYISNDYKEHDYLYINNGNGTFTDKVKECFRHISEFSMGNDVADFNNDGFLDVITVDMLPEDNRRQKLLKGPENYEVHRAMVNNGFHYQFMRNMLQLNNGNGTFSEIGQLAGISNTDWSWAPLFADFDNDGWKDIFISNGYLRDFTNKDFLKYWGRYIVDKAVKMEKTLLMELVEKMPSTTVKNYLFKNNGDLTFSNVTDTWGLHQLILSNGAVYADLDNDGDLEIVTNNVNERAYVFRNNSRELLKNNYLQVHLHGEGKNTFGYGARLNVFSNGQLQLVEQMPTRGYQSSVSPVITIGLGSATLIDTLIVIWPTGKTQKLFNVRCNEKINLFEKDGSSNQFHAEIKKNTFFNEHKGIVNHKHKDYNYNDFKRQPLMPMMLSYTGPVLAKGDINGDGLEDFFIGSSKGQSSKLFVQNTDASFREIFSPLFEEDKYYTATDAIFFDADGDGDSDLYVASGMYHDYLHSNQLLSDRLYINDGTGNFSKRIVLSDVQGAKSCVRVADIDNDGDLDLFVGGRVIPGSYPAAPKSFILKNDGKGNFKDVTNTIAAEIRTIGMVTDAAWKDINGDGKLDLIIVGEWMPITIFINTGDSFVNQTDQYFKEMYSGLWNQILAEDFDNDGDIDLLIGNHGTNTQLKANAKEPLELIFKDFDNNGSIDPFLCFYIQGKPHPYVTRDELLDQIYGLRKKFTSYQSYADATLADIFSSDEIKSAEKLSAQTLETILLENVNGLFRKRNLPVQAQFSPVYSVQLIDVNNDERKDIILLGNHSHPRLQLGKYDANYGTLLLNKGNLEFTYVPQYSSGLKIEGDVKDSLLLQVSDEVLLILGINNETISTYKIESGKYEQ